MRPLALLGLAIVVTGGAGFIGSAVIRHLLAHTADRIVNVDKLTYAAHLGSIPGAEGHPRYRLEQVDICNGTELRRVFQHYRPARILNLAAETHVDRSIDGPAAFVQTNLVGTYTLLDEALRYWRTLNAQDGGRFRLLRRIDDRTRRSGKAGL